MSSFCCWRPDHDETFDDGVLISNAYDAASAAERWVERRFSDWDYPTEVVVRVVEVDAKSGLAKDAERDFVVSVETRPSFRATERKGGETP